GDGALEVLLVSRDGHVPLRIGSHGHTEAGAGHHVFAVGGNEGRTVVACAIGDLNDRLGAEGGKVDQGDAGRVVAIDEHPAPIGYTIGHGRLHVVRVIPRHEAAGGHQHGLGLFAVSPAALGVHREHGYVAEHAARGNAIDRHLAVEAAADEVVELIIL